MFSVYNIKLAVMSIHVVLDALSKLTCKPNPTKHVGESWGMANTFSKRDTNTKKIIFMS